MKKFLATMALLLAVTGIAAADNKPIDVAALPPAAQAFIKKHFPQQRVIYASVDSGLFDTDYDARLDNGTKLEFDQKGVWKEVENKRGNLPTTFVPKYVLDYVQSSFPDRTLFKVERDNRNIEVELDRDLEIVFDRHGKVVHIDD